MATDTNGTGTSAAGVALWHTTEDITWVASRVPWYMSVALWMWNAIAALVPWLGLCPMPDLRKPVRVGVVHSMWCRGPRGEAMLRAVAATAHNEAHKRGLVRAYPWPFVVLYIFLHFFTLL